MNKSVLITGSSRGIGKAIALRLARDDYDIIVHCNTRRDAADGVAQEVRGLGAQSRVLKFNIGEREATAAALNAEVEKHGCYYGGVCTAGVVRDQAFPAMSG